MARKWSEEDRALGMDRRIKRRDFLNGVALTLGAAFFPLHPGAENADAIFAPEKSPDYYPPSITGIRGDHEGSYEVAHKLRDATFWKNAGKINDSGEQYDLVIVGAGISGLAAAHYYRKLAGSKARILILENHDDFGGHAKRNEFEVETRKILGFGGGWSIDSPAPYSKVAKSLIEELGIDVGRWPQTVDSKVYRALGLTSGVYFDKETFGVDRVVPFFSDDDWEDPNSFAAMWPRFDSEAPVTEKAKQDLHKLFTEKIDYMPGLTSAQKKAKLARISYADFLLNTIKVDPQIVKLFQSRTHGLYGVGIESVPAQDAWGLGFPGFRGMNLTPEFGKGMNRDSMRYENGGERYFFHFPDGNATVARLLLRKLIPKTIPGSTTDDVVTARCNYAELDEPSSACRIRLNSTVVRVKHESKASSKYVEIAYMRGDQLHLLRASRCILACWHTVIPYICPELSSQQKDDLAYAVKVPLLYNNVLLSNWKAFVKAGVRDIHCPNAYHSWIALDMPVTIGNYHSSKTPEEPVLLHMMRAPCSPGLPSRSQHRAGRFELFSTTFEQYERNIRSQLSRMLGPYDFDSARDIRAITVNRWAHGYAYQYNSLFDSFWLNGEQTPCERARKPFGRVAIANADAGAYSYMDGAIDQAYRAVQEILRIR